MSQEFHALYRLNAACAENDHALDQLLYKERLRSVPMADKITEKIPDKLQTALEAAFNKAFAVIFDKGTPFIEQMYDKNALTVEALGKDYHLQREVNDDALAKLQKNSRRRRWLNQGFSAVEGVSLGLLGIGLPDIPIFLTTLFKVIYERALSFGFRYDTPDERLYIVLLLRLAAAERKECAQINRQLDAVGRAIDTGERISLRLEDETRLTSKALTMSMLVSKFIMTFFIVGVIGGLYNPMMIGRVDRLATLKYEHRFLEKQQARIMAAQQA